MFFSVLMGAMNMGQAAPFMEAFSVGRGAAANVFEVLERESLIDPSSSEGLKPSHTTGDIGLARTGIKEQINRKMYSELIVYC